MIEDKELDELEKSRSDVTSEPKIEEATVQKTTSSVIDESEQEMLERIKQNVRYQERTEELMTDAANAEFERREIIVLDQKQKNELAKLQLKLNKKTMRDEAKAKHYERKRKAKMIRFGYLYTPYEVELIDPETGELKKETRYKNFTTNTFINRYKEFANFYANLADSTKSIITKTLKIAFWIGLVICISFAIYGLIKWVINSGILNRITETTEQIVRSII